MITWTLTGGIDRKGNGKTVAPADLLDSQLRSQVRLVEEALLRFDADWEVFIVATAEPWFIVRSTEWTTGAVHGSAATVAGRFNRQFCAGWSVGDGPALAGIAS